MKKLIVLVILGLFVASFAMAQDAVVTAEVEARYEQDFTNKDWKEGNIVELEFTATVDDYNELYIELEEGGAGIDESISVSGTDSGGDDFEDSFSLPLLDRAYFTTDLGGIFMLPINLTVRTGFDEYKLFDAAKVTPGEYEDVIGSNFKSWGHRIEGGNDMITVRAAWANDPGLEELLIGASATIGPAYIEAGYFAARAEEDQGVTVLGVTVGEDDGVDTDGEAYENGDFIGMGDIEIGVEFAADVADGMNVAAAATIDYDLSEEFITDPGDVASADVDTGAYWTAGLGAVFTYMDMYKIGVAWKTEQENVAGGAQVNLWGAPIADQPLEILIVLGLLLDPDTSWEDADGDTVGSLFDSLEASVMYEFGASVWYLGLFYSNGGGDIAAEKSDFYKDHPALDGDGKTQASTALFVRAELKY
jgi:hypothetical protein